MNIVGILLLIIHVICCVGVILVVLLQAGKGASLGASFGGGSGQTVFGTGGATFIGKMTWVMAAAFMSTSLLLTIISPFGDGGMGPESGLLQQEPVAAPPLGEEATQPGAVPLRDDLSGDLGPALPSETAPLPTEQP
jgi:preprotein translocase subunit SecG